jgi:hypothetical protein
MSNPNTETRSFYLAPTTWNSSAYRDVYDDDDIKNLPDDWDADADDCDYIGDFYTHEEAFNAAKENTEYASDMHKNFNDGI